jgi:hypothetical protein
MDAGAAIPPCKSHQPSVSYVPSLLEQQQIAITNGKPELVGQGTEQVAKLSGELSVPK